MPPTFPIALKTSFGTFVSNLGCPSSWTQFSWFQPPDRVVKGCTPRGKWWNLVRGFALSWKLLRWASFPWFLWPRPCCVWRKHTRLKYFRTDFKVPFCLQGSTEFFEENSKFAMDCLAGSWFWSSTCRRSFWLSTLGRTELRSVESANKYLFPVNQVNLWLDFLDQLEQVKLEFVSSFRNHLLAHNFAIAVFNSNQNGAAFGIKKGDNGFQEGPLVFVFEGNSKIFVL